MSSNSRQFTIVNALCVYIAGRECRWCRSRRKLFHKGPMTTDAHVSPQVRCTQQRHSALASGSRKAEAHRLKLKLRQKYKQGNSRLGMPALRRRFCVRGTWQFASQRSQVHRRVSRAGHPATATAAAKYRPRGHPRAALAQPANPSGQDTWSARCGGVARRVRRAGRGNPREQSWQGAPVRPNWFSRV